MNKNWIVKLFPFLFKEGPNNKYYWWFTNFIVYDDSGESKIYCFVTKEIYYSFNHSYKIEKDAESKIAELGYEIENLKNENIRKIEQNNYIENEYVKRIGKYQAVSIEKDDKIQKLEELINNYREKNSELNNEIKSLLDRCEEKDKMIGSLRTIINNDREANSKDKISLEDVHTEQIKQLSKQIEYLDRDFVDVAKAMRLYNNKEERPLRGYRIKID